MICTQIHITVSCDRCETGLTADPVTPATTPAVVFPDRIAALAAIDTAVLLHGWARHLDGRLLCPRCADRAWCLAYGHEYRNMTDLGPHGTGEDGTGGWLMCGCDRSIPSHTDTDPDPAGGPGCAMAWRLCGRCEHIDERHVTDPPRSREYPAVGVFDGGMWHQPGGHLRQDVPAGPALPHGTTHHRTSEHVSSEETAILEPPTLGEIAELTERLRRLTSHSADPAEQAVFLADKAALLARIPTGPGSPG